MSSKFDLHVAYLGCCLDRVLQPPLSKLLPTAHTGWRQQIPYYKNDDILWLAPPDLIKD